MFMGEQLDTPPVPATVPTLALSLIQPWASLVALGKKRIETRSWPTRIRGRIAIHASKGFPAECRDLCRQEPFRDALQKRYPLAEFLASQLTAPALGGTLPLASIVAVARLYDCWQFEAGREWRAILALAATAGCAPDAPHELEFGDFTAGRWGFALADVVELRRPVPARGNRLFWRIPEPVRYQIGQELAAA